MSFASVHDFVISAVIGGILSVALIHFGSKETKVSAKVREYFQADDDADKNNESTVGSATDEQEKVLINEENFLEKSKGFRSVFGLSEEQIKDAIKETNEELKREKKPYSTDDDGSMSWSSFMDMIVFLVVIVAICQAVNTMTRGDFARAMAGLLPAEAESIKLMMDKLTKMFPAQAVTFQKTEL